MDKTGFYKNHVVYQIYPRSFKDSNGDGIGDIPGIISKLDYLQDLGVSILWLSPIYPSPNLDYGYDISDYKSINPEYGTMDDFDKLIEEARRRDMRIVMDLVLNHTSSEHYWFKQALKGNPKYLDYYIFRQGKKDNKRPPNNWQSMFLGSAWTYVKDIDLWYLHIYTPGQPDLNWKNPAVLNEVEDIISFWLAKGVYGFRCDSINSIYKTNLEDGKKRTSIKGAEHFMNQEGCHHILHTLYKDVFSKYQCMVVGETSQVDFKQAQLYLDQELDMVFTFEHVENKTYKFLPLTIKKNKPEKWKQIITKWQLNMPYNANYLENHDQLRSVNKYGDTGRYYTQSAKMLAALNLFLKGTPFIFQGEEIGMLDYPSIDYNNMKDIVPNKMKELIHSFHLPLFMGKGLIYAYDRDNPRCPICWDDSVSAGFSTSKDTWLKTSPYYQTINVEKNNQNPDSILYFYKKAIWLRKNEEAFSFGDIGFLPSKKGTMFFTRNYMGKKFGVLLNLTKKRKKMLNPGCYKVILSNYNKKDYFAFSYLEPFECAVISLN